MQEPGRCTRCGADAPEGRNTAGECWRCHNLGYAERKAERRRQLDNVRADGRAYWASRGIKPGDRVYRYAGHMLAPVSMRVEGIAKVGAVGAYVYSSFQPGYLSPGGWHKVGEGE